MLAAVTVVEAVEESCWKVVRWWEDIRAGFMSYRGKPEPIKKRCNPFLLPKNPSLSTEERRETGRIWREREREKVAIVIRERHTRRKGKPYGSTIEKVAQFLLTLSCIMTIKDFPSFGMEWDT